MEPVEGPVRPPYHGPRIKLVLGKFPVTRVIDPGFGIKRFSIRLTPFVIAQPHG